VDIEIHVIWLGAANGELEKVSWNKEEEKNSEENGHNNNLRSCSGHLYL